MIGCLILMALSAADLYHQGTALFEKGRYSEAAQRLEEAYRLAPRDARIAKALGVSYAATGDYERANGPFESACSIDPRLEDACYYYGRNLYALNRFEPALEALSKALRSSRQPWLVHLGIAQASDGLGKSDRARPEFRKAVSLFEELPSESRGRPDFDPRLHYAVFLYRQAQLAEALEMARRVTASWPSYGRGHFELGRILHQQGKLDESAVALEKAAATGFGAPAHLLLGSIYRRLGRDADAQRHLNAAKSSPLVP